MPFEPAIAAQVKDLIERIMADVRAMPRVPPPDLEELRMALPIVGCWNPECVRAGVKVGVNVRVILGVRVRVKIGSGSGLG